MKGHMLCLSIVTALFATSVNAQTTSGRLSADVPFAFSAGATQFPAGHYNLDTPMPNVVRIASADRTVTAMLIVNRSTRMSADGEGKLVFNKYGERYFLGNIWSPGAQDGLQLRPTAVERELSATGKRPETQAVIARRR